jgi:hypothetical protein
VTGLPGPARLFLAVGVLAAWPVLTATAAVAAPAPPPSADAPAVPGRSGRGCTETGGSVWLDTHGRAWCVGGVYTGARLA